MLGTRISYLVRQQVRLCLANAGTAFLANREIASEPNHVSEIESRDRMETNDL